MIRDLEILFLSYEDIVSLNISREAILDFVEVSYREHGEKKYYNPAKTAIHPLDNAFVHAMPAYLPRQEALGIKWVSGFSGNAANNLPSITGVIILNDTKTGFPYAVMDCSWVTAKRTAAASAITAKYLANPDSSAAGIVGAGVQGREHVLMLSLVLPGLKRVKIFDTSIAMMDKLIASVSGKVPFEIVKVSSPEEAIKETDVIVTATGKLTEPVFSSKWVKDGALIMPVHTAGWNRDLPFTADRFIVDDWEQFYQTHGNTSGYYGKLPEPYAQLGEIIVGKKAGREKKNETILVHNFGMAIHDMIVSVNIVDMARKKKSGRTLCLMKDLLGFYSK